MGRRRQAKEAEGAEIHGGGSGAFGARHMGRVRLYVAADYRKQHPAWRRELEQQVEAANPVLRRLLGVQLVASELHEWSPACQPDALRDCLAELSTIEAAPGGEWVVGVFGALPRFTTSFDELGMASLPGSHFVLRDVSDLAERDAIDRAFATHTQTRRDEIYTRRKQHKRLSVFLHEWAHTLGALHSTTATSLLYPTYDERMTSFDDDNAGLLTAAIKDRFAQDGGDQALIAFLDTKPTPGLDQAARARLVETLKQPRVPLQPASVAVAGGAADAGASQAAASVSPPPQVATVSPAATPPAPPAGPGFAVPRAHLLLAKGSDEELLAGLEEKDKDVYHRAVDLLLAGHSVDAFTTLTPLAQVQQANYAIQHLACALSMQQGRMAEAQTYCERVQQMSAARGQ